MPLISPRPAIAPELADTASPGNQKEDGRMLHRSDSIRRSFILSLAFVFLLVVALSLVLLAGFGRLSRESARLAQNLDDTSRLNERIREGIVHQIDLMRHQFDSLDDHFSEKAERINFDLSEQQLNYLRLDIGQDERVTVQKIRLLQAELAVWSNYVYSSLRSGDRAKANANERQIEVLETKLDEEFAALSQLQAGKIQAVQRQFDAFFRSSRIGVYSLLFALIAALAAFVYLVRRRVIQPLASIQVAADRMRQGDFTARAAVADEDEIGRLAREFNFMAEALGESYRSLETKVEERTAQLQELQAEFAHTAKMSALGKLVSGVAHELNNPLTVIMGYTELAIIRQRAAGADAKEIKFFEDIYAQADRCSKIVANLLQFARRQDPQLQPVRINELVEQVLEMREYELTTRNVRLERDFDPADPLISADPYKLQQVVLNLVNNAYDAICETGAGGTVRIRTACQATKVSIEVTDDGTGIREPDRVFEPFYTTKPVGHGTGLGLSICYGIAQEHGGDIRAENLARGARFVVTLPVGDVGRLQTTAPLSESDGEKIRSREALVVDDEETILSLQVELLSNLGINASGARSGDEAVRMLEARDYDVVISDVRMPGRMDGVALYEWVGRNRPELRNRFIFLSGDALGSHSSDESLTSAVPCIQKPFDFQNYARTVTEVLER